MSSKLEKSTYVSSAWWVLIISIVSMFSSYFVSVKYIWHTQNKSINELLTLFEPNLTYVVWKEDDRSIELVLDSISGHKSISAVYLLKNMPQHTTPVVIQSPPGLTYDISRCENLVEIDLKQRAIGLKAIQIGSLKVCKNISLYTRDTTYLFVGIIILQLLVVVLMLFGFFWITNKKIFTRISQMYSRVIAVEKSMKPGLHLKDELDHFEHAMGAAIDAITIEHDITISIAEVMGIGFVLVDDTMLILRTNDIFLEKYTQLYEKNTQIRLNLDLIGSTDLFSEHWTTLVLDAVDNSDRRVQLHVTSVKLPSRKKGALLVFFDVELPTQIQQDALRAQRANVLDCVLGVIAHDFNNVLGIISGSAYLALMDSDLPERCKKLVTQIKNSTAQGASLVDKLYSIADQQGMQERVIDANDVLKKAYALAPGLFGKEVDIQVNYDANGLIFVDSLYLETVLVNLLTNAYEAISGVGKIWMRAFDAYDNGKQTVVFSVVDNGRGIPLELLDRIKEPFFTTKENNRGAGLGLSMVARFAEQAGGKLMIESVPGRTEVSIQLPCVN